MPALLLLGLSYVQASAQIPLNQLSAWFKADEGIVVAGDSVLSWKDCSTNGYTALAQTPTKPILIHAALNNLPSLKFNGFNSGMKTVDSVASFEQKRGTIVVVMKVNGRSLTSSVGSGNVFSTYNGPGIVWQFNATPMKYSFYDGVGAEELVAPGAVPLNWAIVTLVRSTDSTMDFYYDGRYQHSIPVKNLPSNATTIKIGYNGGSHFGGDYVAEVLNGEVAEIILYTRSLDAQELSTVHHYLSDKYNLPLQAAPYYEQLWFYGLLVLLVVLLVLLLVKYAQNRSMKRQLTQLAIQQALEAERKRIAGDMHDEIGSGISRIVLLSQLIRQQQDASDARDNLDKLKSISQQLSGQLNELIWSVNPEQDQLESLLGYIRYYAFELLDEHTVELVTHFPSQLPVGNISPDFRRNLFSITKEALNNVLKYADTARVELSFEVIGKADFLYSIRDFGKGINPDQVRLFSNGMLSMKSRAEAIGCRLEITSIPGAGTAILLSGTINYYQSSTVDRRVNG